VKLDLNKSSHKRLLLLILAVPILLFGFLFTYLSQQDHAQEEKSESKIKEEVSAAADPSPAPSKTGPETAAVQEITQADKDESKMIAEKFAQAYATYEAASPSNFVQNAKPYMTEGFYSRWAENPPRRPLALSKLTVKHIETYPIDGGDKYTIAWNVIVTEETTNTLGDIGTQEEWFWIGLEKENGEWKVKAVDITNG
jgi:hypothetical protein